MVYIDVLETIYLGGSSVVNVVFSTILSCNYHQETDSSDVVILLMPRTRGQKAADSEGPSPRRRPFGFHLCSPLYKHVDTDNTAFRIFTLLAVPRHRALVMEKGDVSFFFIK